MSLLLTPMHMLLHDARLAADRRDAHAERFPANDRRAAHAACECGACWLCPGLTVESKAGWLCCCRDPMYHALKSTLWDLFPAWEDMAVDAAFREMLWASRAGESGMMVGLCAAAA